MRPGGAFLLKRETHSRSEDVAVTTKIKLAASVRALALQRMVMLAWPADVNQPPLLAHVAETVDEAKAFMRGYNFAFCSERGEIRNCIEDIILSRAVSAAELLDEQDDYSMPTLERVTA